MRVKQFQVKIASDAFKKTMLEYKVRNDTVICVLTMDNC